MEERIEQAKHNIAILVENILYSTILALNGDVLDGISIKSKDNEMAIDAFAQECIKRYPELTPEQIREHTIYVLNKTIENAIKMKEDIER